MLVLVFLVFAQRLNSRAYGRFDVGCGQGGVLARNRKTATWPNNANLAPHGQKPLRRHHSVHN
jgi:hypothetical protein